MVPKMATFFHLRSFALSDIGLKRKRNEDAYAVYRSSCEEKSANDTDFLFIVADGIGGNACGDLASRIACRRLRTFFQNSRSNGSSSQYSRRITSLIHQADSLIRRRAAEDPACVDMGTTLSALVISKSFCLTAHVGDSRIYRLRKDSFSQMTTDHTFVQEMIDEGELSPEKALKHPLRNMLMHAVGTQEPLEKIEITVSEVAPGDRFLVCSDGLHDLVERDYISNTLKSQDCPEPAAKLLLKAALDNGGKDNITVIVIYI